MSSQEQNEASHSEADSSSNVVTLPDDSIDSKLSDLKKSRKEAKDSARKASKDLRVATKKRTKLLAKAKLLSSNDLLNVYSMRRDAKVKESKKKK